AEWAACADTGNYSEIYATLSGSRETCSTRLVGQLRESHATRSLATDLELALRLTVISMSRPSTSKSRIKRSIEEPDSLPCFSPETLGSSIPRIAAAGLCVSRRRWISAIIFADNSAFASRSSACGRFKSAKTFPELGVYSRFGIFPLFTSRPACAQVGAVAGSNLYLAAELRFRRLLSSEKHEERKRLPRVVLRTPFDRSRPDPSARTCQTVSVKPCNIFALSCL